MTIYFVPQALVSLLLVVCLSACSLGDRIFGIPENPAAQLDLQLTYISATDTVSYTVQEVVAETAMSRAVAYEDLMSLVKSLTLTAVSTNNDTLSLELWFHYSEKPATENSELALSTSDDTWDYVDQARESEDFFQQEAVARRVNIDYMTSFDPAHSTIRKIRTAMVDGKEESWLQIDLDGEAYGVYTPGLLPYYKFEGRFEGVIK